MRRIPRQCRADSGHQRTEHARRTPEQFEMVRHPEVVVPEVGDPFSARERKSPIVGGRLVSVVLREIFPMETRVAKGGDDSLRVVGAAVADDEQFKVRERLALNAGHRVMESP